MWVRQPGNLAGAPSVLMRRSGVLMRRSGVPTIWPSD